MAFIGYNTAGYEDLVAEIGSRKTKLLEILNSFVDVQTAIADCWKGNDADAYKAELERVILNTKQSVEETYSAMSAQFKRTHDEWVSKQNVSDTAM